MKIKKLKNAMLIWRHYLRWPYPVYKAKRSSFDGFAHEHICFAARFPNVDLPILCPIASPKGFCPGISDECENCCYFGTVYYIESPDTGEPQLRFEMNSAVTELIK